MSAYSDLMSKLGASPPANHAAALRQFRQGVESLQTAEAVRTFFNQRLSSDDIQRLCRNSDSCKKLLGLLQIKAEGYFRDHLAPAFWTSLRLSGGGSDNRLDIGLNDYHKEILNVVDFFIQALEHLSVVHCALAHYEAYRIRNLIVSAQLALTKDGTATLARLTSEFYTLRLEELMAAQAEHPVGSSKHVSEALKYLNLSDINESALKTAVFSELKKRLSCLSSLAGTSLWTEIYKDLKDYALEINAHFLRYIADGYSFAEWEEVLLACVGRAVGLNRIEKLYEIVVDFPESVAAMTDLKTSLKLGHVQEREIIAAFVEQITKRLLQAGAATEDIVAHFLKASKLFSEINPQGGIIETVSETYKVYLRDRIDTMKCIVSCLADTTQEKPCVLEEIADAMPEVLSDTEEDSSLVALEEMQQLLKAGTTSPEKPLRDDGHYDVVSMMLGIYSSPEQFTQEYKKLLAEQLLVRSDLICEREYRVFELLKRRFDDPKLGDCEVMIHDINQSRVINPTLQEETTKQLRRSVREDEGEDSKYPDRVSALMFSYLYWPEQKEYPLVLPPGVQETLDVFSTHFAKHKVGRTLNWKPSSGVVQLDVRMGGQVRSFTVDPILATLICCFKQAHARREADLADVTGLTAAVVKSKISFWINNGILCEKQQESETWYHLCSEMQNPVTTVAEDSDDEAMDSEETDETDSGKFECFKVYILEFLKHRGETFTSLVDIHKHLEKFVKQHKFDMSQAELAEYLESLVVERVMKHASGGYKLLA